MNILYICDEFSPGKTGGIGSVVSLLSKALSAQGHSIYVVGLYPHGYGAPDYEEQDGVKVWRLRYATDIGFISGSGNLKDKILTHALRKTGILNVDAKKQLSNMFKLIRSLIKTHCIDIIEMPDWNDFYFNVGLKDLLIPDFGIPLVVKMHGTDSYFKAEQETAISPGMFSKESIVYQRADALSSVSAYTAGFCKALYKLNKSIEILHNGTKVEAYPGFQQRANSLKVIFSGSLLRKKGIHSLLAAWKAVVLKVPTATLHIYGKGDHEALESLLEPLAALSVFFHGHVPRDLLLQELRTADLAVFPSYSETFGLGVVEAMAAGCPVIYTKRSCGPEIVADRTEGILVDPANPAEISDAIMKLLTDPTLRETLSLAAYEKVKSHFEIGHIAEQHTRFYEIVISRFKTAH